MDLDTVDLTSWTGRSEVVEDVVTAFPVAALAATLDQASREVKAGDELPPLWHWLFFLPRHPRSELGPDGHARRGGFLPPVPLPRRMWAGGRLVFHAPIRIGDRLRRVSVIESVAPKQGRTGMLVFVVVRHEIHGPGGLALTEWHDIVYRDLAPAGSSAPPAMPPPANPQWVREVIPDDVLLFRYSALTFNGHRIHYDRRYVTEVEGYPGLIVHGPLLATLLAGLAGAEASGARMERFTFRAVGTVFDGAPFRICGRPGSQGGETALWAETSDGALAMQATATFPTG